MPPLATLTAAAVFALALWIPGAVCARAFGLRADLFARVWCGLAATSIVGVVLAQVGLFSLVALGAALAALCGTGLLAGLLRERAAARRAGAARNVVSPLPGTRAVRALACAAGLGAVIWCWPPFETVIAASDSTMYVNAGIHLARTGKLAVEESVFAMIGPMAAVRVFPPLGWTGPFIRLPGGLLVSDFAGGQASPAFFALLPVWTGILAAAGGPEAAPMAAPLLAGLAVWAVVLFAGESFGLAAAAAASVFFVANFALWWFGRFAMPETLTCALVWGGFVFLGRLRGVGGEPGRRDALGEPVLHDARGWALPAGILLGVAGLARTETFLFLAAAGALSLGWARRRALTPAVAAGFGLVLALGVWTIAGAPSHHLAYLRADVFLRLPALRPGFVWAMGGWRLAAAAALVAAFLLAAGVFGRRRGSGLWRGVFGGASVLAVVAALVVYTKLGGAPQPLRSLGWLANYCSPVLLTLAVAGAIVVWRRGGPAARLAALVWLLAALVFVVNPRVGAYQPWAIRRFLPIVIPGITIAAAAAVALLWTSRRRVVRAAALVAVLAVLALEVRPVLALRAKPFFAGSFAAIRRVAAAVPAAALVVIDASLADDQIQVPLWLVHGRESVVLWEGGVLWRSVLRQLASGGRPVYWITNRYAPPPTAPGLLFGPLGPGFDLAVRLPEAPADVPPARMVTRILPLRIYRVARFPAR